MMRLPSFRFRAPRTIAEAAAWLAESPGDTMLVAGGTDLVPNMKRRQQVPRTVVALRQIAELSRIQHNGGVTLGATLLVFHHVLAQLAVRTEQAAIGHNEFRLFLFVRHKCIA